MGYMVDSEIERKILKIFNDQNPWWFGEKIRGYKEFKRRDYWTLIEKIDLLRDKSKKIMMITGLRQIGKSTILFQLIDFLIKTRDVEPRKILFLSFDYPSFIQSPEVHFDDLMEIYSTRILKKPFKQISEETYTYIFLDEICKLKNWDRILKGWYDLGYPIKFIVSDSSCAYLLRGSESLIGRITPYLMFPFKFVDLVRYYKEKEKKHEEARKIDDSGLLLRSSFYKASENKDPKIFFNSIQEVYPSISYLEEEIKIFLQRYILVDGFPGLLPIEDLFECSEQLRYYINLTLAKDLVRVFNIRNMKAMEDLVALIAEESAQKMNYESLCRNLSIGKTHTVKEYLDFLESSFLVCRSGRYSGSRASSLRKDKKIYFTNVGLRNAITGTLSMRLFQNQIELGKVVETLVYEHCKRLKFNLEPGIEPKLYYWNNKKGEEIDIIMEFHGIPIPIESKYGNKIEKKVINRVNNFVKEYNSPFGIIITKDTIDLKDNVLLIPLWIFLLIC